MRIARIIEYFPPHVGGMERHGLILSQEQIKLGHEVDVFIGYGDEKLLPRIYKMPLQFLPLYSKLRRFWFNVWAFRQIKRRHKKNPYEVVHLHGDFVEAYFGGKLSKKLNIPAILTIHAGLNKKLLKPKNKKVFDGINNIICVSQNIAEELKSIGVAEGKITVISSGVNLVEFKSINNNNVAELRNKYSKPLIISVGVLRPNKGFSYLIEAFKEIKQKINSATLVIIGNGPERAMLENRARGIHDVYFLGSQSHADVLRYLKAADIFVLASDREGTSTSIMEAMAAGLSIVTTKVGGNPYLIKDGENGILVEEKNSDALAKAMIKLIGDENLREKMRDKNLEDIKEKNWPIIAKKITDLYF